MSNLEAQTFQMKTAGLAFFALLLTCCAAAQNSNNSKQPVAQLTEKSVVKDTLGTVYPFAIWRQLFITGHYDIKPENPADANTAFIITRLSEEEYEKKMMAMPKPRESAFFKTGSKFSYFKGSDINGNKVNSKTMAGKILVLNYWFINCPPCRMEIPELNKLRDEFKNDTSIQFIAVALDNRSNLKDFLRTTPFNYTIVDDGRYIAAENAITSYPTNVIVDHEGKVYFHSSGLSANMIYWLKKSITELKQKMEKKEVAAN